MGRVVPERERDRRRVCRVLGAREHDVVGHVIGVIAVRNRHGIVGVHARRPHSQGLAECQQYLVGSGELGHVERWRRHVRKRRRPRRAGTGSRVKGHAVGVKYGGLWRYRVDDAVGRVVPERERDRRRVCRVLGAREHDVVGHVIGVIAVRNRHGIVGVHARRPHSQGLAECQQYLVGSGELGHVERWRRHVRKRRRPRRAGTGSRVKGHAVGVKYGGLWRYRVDDAVGRVVPERERDRRRVCRVLGAREHDVVGHVIGVIAVRNRHGIVGVHARRSHSQGLAECQQYRVGSREAGPVERRRHRLGERRRRARAGTGCRVKGHAVGVD